MVTPVQSEQHLEVVEFDRAHSQLAMLVDFVLKSEQGIESTVVTQVNNFLMQNSEDKTCYYAVLESADRRIKAAAVVKHGIAQYARKETTSDVQHFAATKEDDGISARMLLRHVAWRAVRMGDRRISVSDIAHGSSDFFETHGFIKVDDELEIGSQVLFKSLRRLHS